MSATTVGGGVIRLMARISAVRLRTVGRFCVGRRLTIGSNFGTVPAMERHVPRPAARTRITGRTAATGFVAAALGISLTACGSSEDKSGKAAAAAATKDPACTQLASKYPSVKGKSLTIGYTAAKGYDAPDETNPRNVVGVEPTLMSALSSCLNFKYKYSSLDFDGLIPALKANRINVVSAGMYASDERAQQVDFAQYMKAGEAAVVQSGNPKGLRSLEQTCGVTAAEVVGTVENAILQKQSKACTAAGKPPIKALSFKAPDRALDAVASKRADLFFTDAGLAAYHAKHSGGKLALGYSIKTDFVFGFAVKKGQQDLLSALNDGLTVLYKNGQLLKIMKQWGFRENQLFQPAIKS